MVVLLVALRLVALLLVACGVPLLQVLGLHGTIASQACLLLPDISIAQTQEFP